MKQLINDIQEVIIKTGGTWGIHLEDLDKNETWSWNEDELFYPASVIKVPIMAAVFSAYEEGLFKLSDTIVLKREDLVRGSGVLQHLTPGISLTIYDYITLMIIQSDNTATNKLIDLVGIEKIQRTMDEIGMKNSRFYNKLMTVPVKRAGRNLITALDLAILLKKLTTGSIISRYACEQMIEIMKKQQIRECLPGRFPYKDSEIVGVSNEWELANKTGWVPGTRHDMGVLYVGQRKMNIVVLTKEIDDLKSKQSIAQVGVSIFRYLKT